MIDYYQNGISNIDNSFNGKYVFIRIPKTGSTSINKSIGDNYLLNKTNWGHYSSIFLRDYIGVDN